MVALAAALFAAPAMAQDKEKSQAEWDNKVKTELKLTADQTSQYDAISTEFKGKIETLKADNSLTAEAKAQKKMELKKEKETKINQILTSDQQAKYSAMVEKKKSEVKKEKKTQL